MAKLIVGILIGLIVGGGLTFYMFVGVPRASQIPGTPIQPPDPNGAGGTAQIVLKQEFFNEVLGAIFRDTKGPSFQLASAGEADTGRMEIQHAMFQDKPPCDSRITILKEGSGVQTGLHLDNNRISGPLAFSGNYNSAFGCLQFTGWAQTNLELRFDKAQQVVLGNVNVETVNLDGVNPLLTGLITPIVQSTLNSRVNPVRILDGKQIAIDVPIASTGGKLQASVSDVRADLKDNALNLYVVYAFSGSPTP